MVEGNASAGDEHSDTDAVGVGPAVPVVVTTAAPAPGGHRQPQQEPGQERGLGGCVSTSQGAGAVEAADGGCLPTMGPLPLSEARVDC